MHNNQRPLGARIALFCLVLCLSLAVATACRGNPDDTLPDRTSEASAGAPVMSDLPEPSGGVVVIGDPSRTSEAPTDGTQGRWKDFSVQGVAIAPGDDMESVLRELGDPNSKYESPSCLFEGNDLVYSYDGFDVNAAVIDGKEVCVGVFLEDESVQTPEGIALGSSLADVLGAFGEPDEEETGQYNWFGDDSELVIVVIDDAVTSISYLMLVNP